MKHEPLKTYLRTHRKRTGLSQQDVGYLLGATDGSVVSRHEIAGRLPKLDTALAYGLIFDVDVESLYAGAIDQIERGVRRRAASLVTRVQRQPATPVRSQKLRSLARIGASNRATQ